MDSILQRMLRVEEEAREVIRAAEAEAADIRDEGRREASALEESMQTRTAEEAAALVATRIADAEEARRKAIEVYEAGLDSLAAEFKVQLSHHRQFLVQALAFPAAPK